MQSHFPSSRLTNAQTLTYKHSRSSQGASCLFPAQNAEQCRPTAPGALPELCTLEYTAVLLSVLLGVHVLRCHCKSNPNIHKANGERFSKWKYSSLPAGEPEQYLRMAPAAAWRGPSAAFAWGVKAALTLWSPLLGLGTPGTSSGRPALPQGKEDQVGHMQSERSDRILLGSRGSLIQQSSPPRGNPDVLRIKTLRFSLRYLFSYEKELARYPIWNENKYFL